MLNNNEIKASGANSTRRFLENYFFNIVVCLAALFLYLNHPYYLFLNPYTKVALKIGFGLFIFVYPILYMFSFRKGYVSKSTKYEKIKHGIGFLFKKGNDAGRSADAKSSILSYLVKVFFLPLMINFFFSHLELVFTNYLYLDALQLNWFTKIFSQGYHLILNSLFLIDTLVFVVGYSLESEMLGNQIKSVEPTMLGWTVALACYPPFNSSISQFIPLVRGDLVVSGFGIQNILDVMVIALFAIYVWATISLGFKASNLTNRGIVKKGPYKYCRHPAYIAKNMAWWLEYMPYLNWLTALALLGWNFVYILRARTEESHLGQDSDYVEYCSHVKWKFIPGLY